LLLPAGVIHSGLYQPYYFVTEATVSPFLRFLLYRLLSIPVTLLIVSLILYGTAMLFTPEQRASLYLPKSLPSNLTEEDLQRLTRLIIRRYHLNAPFPVQYSLWLGNLLRGQWGYSPVMRDDVLDALISRTPATAELTLYSLLFFVPLGLVSGVIAGWKKGRGPDNRFRLLAFIATSIPPFILAILLLTIFYIGLYWFPPERISTANSLLIRSSNFHTYTGLITLDGLLNGRPDITLDALRHLVLPVLTLSLLHWATLGRVTRAAMIEELQKDYIIAARARGIPERKVVWQHSFRNTFAPALTSATLSAAALVTGIYVVEIIFNFHGVSEIIVRSMEFIPDAPAALGFSIYSVMVVLVLMFALDIVQAAIDPRLREGLLGR